MLPKRYQELHIYELYGLHLFPLTRSRRFEALRTGRCTSCGRTGGSTTRTRSPSSRPSSSSKMNLSSISEFRFSARALKTCPRFSRRPKLGSGLRSFISVVWRVEPIILRRFDRRTLLFQPPTTNFSALPFLRRQLAAVCRSFRTGSTLKPFP